jgi:acetyl esterase/lipase
MSSPENIAMHKMLRERGIPTGNDLPAMRTFFEGMYADYVVPASVKREKIEANGVDAEWFRVDNPKACIIFSHGGGYVLGSTTSHQALIGEIADAAGVDTLGINYRLAPEHPFPAGLDDLIAAYRYVLDSGIPAEKIALAGDSAGGGLTLSGLLTIRQQGLPSPRCAYVISPWTDLTTTLPTMTTHAELDPICTLESLQGLSGLYSGNPKDPIASPLHGDWSGQPPLYIQVGEYEILLDDSRELAKKARAAGVDVSLEISPMGVHVYPQMSQIHPEGADAIVKAGIFLKKHLG